jgi:hypothetical protein
LLTLVATLFLFFAAYWFALLLLFLIQPQPYSAHAVPEFQAKRQNNYKLFTVF